MPQMSPNLWLLIMILTMMMYLILMFKLYFINLKWNMNNSSNKMNIKLNKVIKNKW